MIELGLDGWLTKEETPILSNVITELSGNLPKELAISNCVCETALGG